MDIFSYNKIDKSKNPIRLIYQFIFFIVILSTIGFFLNTVFRVNNAYNSDNGAEVEILSIILLVFLGSIKEELKYRLFLTVFNINFLLFSLSILISDIILIIGNFRLYYYQSPFKIISHYGFLFFVSILIFFTLKILTTKYYESLKQFFIKYFSFILIVQCAIFSFWHVIFTDQTESYALETVFFMHLTSAFFYSFVRIRYGIIYSILVHLLYNSLINFLIYY